MYADVRAAAFARSRALIGAGNEKAASPATIRLNSVLVIALFETESAIELRHRMGPAALVVVGRLWRFDVRRRAVTKNGKPIADFSGLREILIEGDFRGETDSRALFVVTAAGKRIEVASASARMNRG